MTYISVYTGCVLKVDLPGSRLIMLIEKRVSALSCLSCKIKQMSDIRAAIMTSRRVENNCPPKHHPVIFVREKGWRIAIKTFTHGTGKLEVVIRDE